MSGVRVTAIVEPHVDAWLRAQAVEHGVTRSQVVAAAIDVATLSSAPVERRLRALRD